MKQGTQSQNSGTTQRDGVRREGAGGVQDGGTHVHLWLIHVNVWQKPPQHCKAISLQLKLKNKESDTTELYVCIYMYILCIYI